MTVLTPLREQAPVPLPDEEPLLNLQFGPTFEIARIADIRHQIAAFLGSNVVRERVMRPVPATVRDRAARLITEELSNAHRPEKGRIATSLLVWGKEGWIDLAVGDNSDDIDEDDGREQTLVLPSDEYGTAPELDVDAILDQLEEHGLGELVMERDADEVFWSRVSQEDAAAVDEPRTHKIVHNVVYV